MKTDLKTQLAHYGELHRSEQTSIQVDEVFVESVASTAGPNYRVRRLVVSVGAAAFVVLLIGIPALLFRSPTANVTDDSVATVPVGVPSSEPEVIPSTEPETTASPEAAAYDYAMVEELGDGSLVGIQQGSIWRSTDGGESWSIWYEQGIGIDVMVKAPDGAIIALFNSNSTTEALGADSTVNDTPVVHRFDPTTEAWSIIELERPQFPGGNESAQPIDNDETSCVRSGLESWVDGNSAMVGDRIVILGDQRVMGKGICEGDYQFLWTSEDGLHWRLITDMGVDGYLTELLWWNDQYIAIGADRPHFIGGGGPRPRIWASSDLESWTERPLDVSAIPMDGDVNILPGGVEGWNLPWTPEQAGYSSVPVVVVGSDSISITFNVLHFRPGLDESITSLDALEQWLTDTGQPKQTDPSLGELLEVSGIDFPLDAEELKDLNSSFNIQEPYGTFTVTSTDGLIWTTSYSPPAG